MKTPTKLPPEIEAEIRLGQYTKKAFGLNENPYSESVEDFARRIARMVALDCDRLAGQAGLNASSAIRTRYGLDNDDV